MQPTPQSKRPSRPLPDHIARDPHMMVWRLDHHEDRLTALETRHHISSDLIDRIPWARLIPAAIAIVLFLTGLISKQELVSKLLLGG